VKASKTEHAFWFGRHKGEPLSAVPSDYLVWALSTVRMSRGFRAAVEAELAARGVAVPARRPWDEPRGVR
jgi:hypothetical protein